MIIVDSSTINYNPYYILDYKVDFTFRGNLVQILANKNLELIDLS